jgi:16S rRNA (adenine1518-N6/adenine1519-N6)-dimethyltransferase
MSAQTRSEISGLLKRHGLSPNRQLGQHFLADGNITRKIVATAGITSSDRVVEVGAGTGTLTLALAATGARIVAYEVDTGLARVLEEVLHGTGVEIRIRDITEVDLGVDLEGGSWKMVANLPYNVGTPLVLDSIRHHPEIESFTILVQREVAERFVAPPGGKAYGLPSVIAQVYTDPTLAFRVPPQVFYPPPTVESAVVVMARVDPPEEAAWAVEIARNAFGQRRKMLRRSLARLIPDVEDVLDRAGIDPSRRAEDLSPLEYLRIAEVSPA